MRLLSAYVLYIYQGNILDILLLKVLGKLGDKSISAKGH